MSAASTDALRLAESARTVEEMTRAAQALYDWPTLEAIPLLGRLDRRAKGWLFSLAGWLAVALAVLFAVACLLVFWIALWSLGITALVQLVDQLHPGWSIGLVVVPLAMAATILYHDPRLHRLVEDQLSLNLTGLASPLRWGSQGVRLLVYLLAVLIVGGLLAIPCLVVAVTALDWGSWLVGQFGDLDRLLVYLFGHYWPVGLSITLFVTLAVLGLRSLHEHSVLVAVGVLVGVWGLIRLILATNALWPGREWIPFGVIMGAAAVYPSRLPFELARIMTLPMHWANSNAHRLAKRLRLRKLLWSAVGKHRGQNVSRTGKKWKLALCFSCLARLERQQARLAYCRRLRYACCRRCHSDQPCYQNVRQAEGWLDRDLGAPQEQVDDAVRVNLLPYLENQGKPLPFDLDLLVVGNTTEHQVEAFLTLYQERGRQQPIRPISQMSYRLEPNSSIGPNIRAMLQDTFNKEAN